MTDLEEYFAEAERLGLGDRDEILRRTLHLDTIAVDHARTIVGDLSPELATVLVRLDFAVRVRNPGVHYVRRSRFLGYRREGEVTSQVGFRSQIFLSVVPMTGFVKLVFVAPEDEPMPPFVESLDERGHHGVGTAQCIVRTTAEVDAFVDAMSTILTAPLSR